VVFGRGGRSEAKRKKKIKMLIHVLNTETGNQSTAAIFLVDE
jgi:hypothetical protein